TYEGNLLLVSPEFVSIRLADGRVLDSRTPKSGALGSELIAASYKLGDHVEIAAKSIGGVLDRKTDHWLVAELKKIRVQRAPTPEEMAKCMPLSIGKRATTFLRRLQSQP